ncbi:MAG: nuclear transport factor 2 family protein, partial [Pirellulales bacterium]|nr:nuclear transport factor 2 family protein [Pirellulales bacterium]
MCIRDSVSTEIQTTFTNYLDAFNRHDAIALAAHWVQDGENLDLDTGNRIVGQHAVKHVFDRLFARDDGARIGFQIDSIRPIHDDVAVVDGTSQMSFNDQKSCRSRFSAVLVRHEDRWLMESVRESSASAEPTIHDRLQQLDWLRGFWEDISDGITASLQCEWNEQGTFLIRRYLVTKEIEPRGAEERLTLGIPALLPNEDTSDTPDRLTTTEYIGWNPQQGQICSWLFRSDGQMARFAWQRNGNTWLLQSLSDRNSNEIPAQYSLHRAGEDELTLEHLSGSDCALIPEADFLRTARPVENSMTSF